MNRLTVFLYRVILPTFVCVKIREIQGAPNPDHARAQGDFFHEIKSASTLKLC